MHDASRLMLEKVLPIKRMAAANNRCPRGFLLITGWHSHSSVCPLWQISTPPHFGHWTKFSNSCLEDTISSLDNYFLSSGNSQWDLNLHHNCHPHHHVYPFYHRQGRLVIGWKIAVGVSMGFGVLPWHNCGLVESSI